MKVAWRFVLLLAVLVAGVVWWRCGATPPQSSPGRAAPIERVVPRGALGVAFTRSLGQTGGKLKVLESLKVSGFLAQLQGFAGGAALMDEAMKQLGVDVRSEEALKQHGLDGARGAALMVLVPGTPALALPVSDEALFRETFVKLSAQRLGAPFVDEREVGGAKVVTVSLKQGEAPLLGYTVAHGFAIVGDERLVKQLPAFVTLKEDDCLTQDREYLARLDDLPPARDLTVYVPGGSPALFKLPVANALMTATLTAQGLELTFIAQWKDDGSKFAALVPQPVPKELTGLLPRDAFLVGRFSGDATKLGKWSRELMGSGFTKVLDGAGFDLNERVYSQLEPGAVFSLALAEAPPLGAGIPDLDVRRTNPFAYAQLSGAAKVKSPEAVWPALEQLATVAPQFGAQMEVRTRDDGQKALLTTWAQGEGVHFTVKGDTVLFGSPVQRLHALVSSDGAQGSPVSGLQDDAVAIAIDLRKLTSSVRELPDSAWGLGGFAMKSAATRWLDAVDDLTAITVQAGVRDQRVRGRVVLKLGAD